MYDKQKAMEKIEFMQMLHLTDDFYGKPFVLQPWQSEIISDVYGTVKENGYRQYKHAYLEIPKKNGKTTFIAGLGLTHLTLDSNGGQIYCCAADKEQAGLVYLAAKQMIEQDEELEEILKVVDSKKMIINKITGTFIKVLSAEAFTKHGVNPTVVIFDELHAQPNRELYDVMTFGAGATRKEPIWWVITTAGDDPDRNSIGWEVHEYARKIQDGEIEDPNWYVKIYGAKENDDIYDEAVWYKSNPSLGVTMDIEVIRSEAITAKNNDKVEKLFRWLRLNQWVALKSIGWLPLTLYDTTVGDWDISDMIGKKCYMGLDLASTTDLTALTLLFPPQDDIKEWRFFGEAWIPEDNMKERVKRDHVPYDRWVNERYIHATAGNVTDYGFVQARIESLAKQYDVAYLCCDPWNSRMLTQKLEKTGMEIIEVGQTIKLMSPAMKELERLLKIGEMTHTKNPVERWCFGNVIVAVDGNANIKPMKNRSLEKIDMTVAWINAMAIAITQENYSGYDDREEGDKLFCV